MSPASLFRDEQYPRWWQFLVDEAISTHIDPNGTLEHFGGHFIWHVTPGLGLVLRAAPGDGNPTPWLPNLVAGRMLKMALGTRTQGSSIFTAKQRPASSAGSPNPRFSPPCHTLGGEGSCRAARNPLYARRPALPYDRLQRGAFPTTTIFA